MEFRQHQTAILVTMYNDWARELGEAPVKKFADRARAERRTAEMHERVREARAKKAIAETKDKSPTPDTKGPPPRKMTEAEGLAQEKKNSEAINPPLKPDPAALYAALGGTLKGPALPRWRKPKMIKPSRVAYRPRVGSLQELMYKMLTQEGGVTVEGFCAAMEKQGAKPTMLKHEQTWSNLGYLFVSLRGYGLEFDGQHIWLLVPKDERDAAPPKPKKEG